RRFALLSLVRFSGFLGVRYGVVFIDIHLRQSSGARRSRAVGARLRLRRGLLLGDLFFIIVGGSFLGLGSGRSGSGSLGLCSGSSPGLGSSGSLRLGAGLSFSAGLSLGL